ncbi:hypothetical protein JR316_0009674 [Psilocybe cubensis]|uniref:Uncharacterized protein n=1 Tax=Psilocybe cubensis TaxID=181762 RepID=A0ACB8GQH1_PSICU|nr:hypothetical protein JR316_0009674 [Psilocybe cubensis]KAH9477461.1 hypothetical protein JR316_0009674 [Psilocybe cubensis]
MHETRRLLEAAAALSLLLRNASIPHAFYGSVLTAVLANTPLSDASGHNQAHPFRRTRDAVSGNEDFTVTHSPWTNRLHVTYRRLIPAIDIEILPAGETGPRHLDTSTVMRVQNVPFLTVSEFIRAKLKSWVIRGSERDAQDILYVFVRYWNRVDINRITEQDMNVFVSRNASAAPAWLALRRKYGM